MSEFVMTINGETAPTEGTFGVRNPATGEVFAQAPECSRHQLDAAFDAAAKAAREWKSDEAVRRAEWLATGSALFNALLEDHRKHSIFAVRRPCWLYAISAAKNIL